jgi:hypothetical protein
MKRADVFEELDPPPGGLVRLRARLDRPDRSRSNLWRVAFVAAPASLAAAALLVFVLGRPEPPDLVAAAREGGGIAPSALGLSPPPPTVAVVDTHFAGLLSVRTTDPNVVFAWVGTR